MAEPLGDLSPLSIDAIAALLANEKRPPVDRWDPPLRGDSKVRIARDGRWFHDGTEILRSNLVRLFASILRRESDGRFVLVTPVEKQTVAVEDAPFIAVELHSEGSGRHRTLAFRTNVGDLVLAGKENPLRFEAGDTGPAPYVLVRSGLEARIGRPVFYELAELALNDGESPPGLWSQGQFYSMGALL